MYSEVPHEEDALHEKDDLAEEYTVLQRNCLVLEHRLRNLRIWIYSLIALLVICFTLLLLSLGIKPKPMESVSRYVTPVPQCKFTIYRRRYYNPLSVQQRSTRQACYIPRVRHLRQSFQSKLR